MFDVGFSEVLLIAVVALLVLGPERLPKAARFTGLWVRRARSQWDSVRTELERELAAEDIKRSVDQARRKASDMSQGLTEADASLRDQTRALEQELRAEPAAAYAAPGDAVAAAAAPDQPASDASTPAAAAGQSIDLEAPLPAAQPGPERAP